MLIIKALGRLLILTAMLMASIQAQAGDRKFALPAKASFLMPVSAGPGLLKQCSRQTPRNVSEFWPISAAHVAKLEELLPAYIAQRARKKQPNPAQIAFHRQYVGIVIDGKKLIYGNFYSAYSVEIFNSTYAKDEIPPENIEPYIVCDGGSAHWGIVFDPETNTFSELSLNGHV